MGLGPSSAFLASPATAAAVRPGGLGGAYALPTAQAGPYSAVNGAGPVSVAAGRPLPPSSPSPLSGAPQQPQERRAYDELRLQLLLHAAASLQRLSFRRGGSLHHAEPEHCAVLLHCDAGCEADVATLLAGWLHWHK
jgi:hypothetical protein